MIKVDKVVNLDEMGDEDGVGEDEKEKRKKKKRWNDEMMKMNLKMNIKDTNECFSWNVKLKQLIWLSD